MQSINGSEKKDQLGILESKAGMVKRPEKNCYQACPLFPWRTSMQTQASKDLGSRLRLTPFWNMLLSFLFIYRSMFIFTTQK